MVPISHAPAKPDPLEIFRDFAARWDSGKTARLSWWSDSELWTRGVIATFREMGNERGYEVYPDPQKKYHTQYLVDLAWSREDGNRYLGLDLALESEWGAYDEVRDDFYKLIDVKAPLKVMVWASVSKPKKDLPSELAQLVADVTLRFPEEVYLIITFRRIGAQAQGGYAKDWCLIDTFGRIADRIADDSRNATSLRPS